MKKTLYNIVLIVLTVVSLTGCHSSEENYREAYEKVVEHRKTGISAEAYAKIEAERQRYTHVIDGDSVRMVYMNVNAAIDTTLVAKLYNIIVASFTQRINAKSYCDRLREECGMNDSYILFGGPDKKYFVVARGFDDKVEAVRYMRELDRHLCLKRLEPIPWIIRKL